MDPWKLTDGLQNHGMTLRSPGKVPLPIERSYQATIYIIFIN